MDALHLAVHAQTERAAIAVLCGLHGVDVPVASAILTAVAPERFTIIDYRALESLGVTNYVPTVDFYLAYLRACRELVRENTVSLRELDRALWQWSKEHSSVDEAQQRKRTEDRALLKALKGALARGDITPEDLKT